MIKLTLGEVILALELHNPDNVIRSGWDGFHSWRGDYCELAFKPASDVRVGDMLFQARSARYQTLVGYKGGDYEMTSDTVCNIAPYGYCGHDGIDAERLNGLLADVVDNTPLFDNPETAARVKQGGLTALKYGNFVRLWDEDGAHFADVTPSIARSDFSAALWRGQDRLAAGLALGERNLQNRLRSLLGIDPIDPT